MERVELASVDQLLDDHEGRRDRQARADDQRSPRLDAERDGQDRADAEDDPDLEQRPRDRDPRNRPELAKRELDAEREQEEDHAEVGELGDPLCVTDEAGRERTDDDAGNEIAKDCRLPEPNRDDAEDQRHADRDPEVEDEAQLVGQLDVQLHGRLRGQRGLGGLGRLGMGALSRAARVPNARVRRPPVHDLVHGRVSEGW